MPDTHRLVSQRWRAWFVHVDPDAQFPQWIRTSLSGPGARFGTQAEPEARGVLLGPFPDKDSAGRFIELVIDAFDLCREYPLLVQAPKARACPYKEMGRCPAPCDGSEPLPSYRLRTRRAVETLVGGLADMRTRLLADMAGASAAADYEFALALKNQVDRLNTLAGPAFAQVRDARRWRGAIVLPGRGRTSCRVLLLAGARLGIAGEFDAPPTTPADGPSLEPLAARMIATASAAPPLTGTPEQLDTLAAITRWLFTPVSRRRGVFVPIDDQTSPPTLATELARLARAVHKGKAKDAPVPDQALESV
jgi:excinuclease UvrABC nuclease subunit